MFKKIMAFIFISAQLILCSAQRVAVSITPEEIHEQIQYAIILLRKAERRLKLKNPELTNTFIKERTNDDGHDAEVELRRLYPAEYMAYIEAKSNLDSLLYTQYLIFANGKPE